MIYIFKDQTAARLILETSVDFSSYVPSGCKIGYEKPDGTVDTWDAEVLAGSESVGKIYVDFSDTVKFDTEGMWKFWAEVTFADGRVGYGSVYHYYVYEKGNSQI